jgi:Na+-translocating ferredoxin:NAD+ oxidoreductase RnfD subunit
LLFFALFLAVKDKDFIFLFTTLIAVVSALAIEAIVLYLKTKAFRITESAIITGLIIGFVLSSDEVWWKFVFASALAIFSKQLIRFQKRHIFNPAAFGIFLSTILLGASTQWKGTYLWYIVVPLGIYFAYKTKKMEVIMGYAIIFLMLFGVQAFLKNFSLFSIFGYLNYFYIFVMIIEPKTTPAKTAGKYIFGAGTAALIFILTEAGVKFDVELFSLLAMNVTVPLLNKLSFKPRRVV